MLTSFDAIFDECLSQCGKTVPLRNRKELAEVVFNLVFTKLSCKCSARNSGHLSTLLVSLVGLGSVHILKLRQQEVPTMELKGGTRNKRPPQ